MSDELKAAIDDFLPTQIIRIDGDMVEVWVTISEDIRVKTSIPQDAIAANAELYLIPNACFEWSPTQHVARPMCSGDLWVKP